MMSYFERVLLKSRFITFLAVIFSLIGTTIVFIVASYDIMSVLIDAWNYYINDSNNKSFHDDVLGSVIGAIDLYLIALVLLIFSFGVYELFIAPIEAAKTKNLNVLEVHSLDQLKDKIAKVVIMVLIVKFFQKVIKIQYSNPLDMLYFAGAIFLLALGLYFLGKGGK